MSFTVVIPSRYASTRLPGKPLLDIAGKPMVLRVYERACDSEADRVVVATDDSRIADALSTHGVEVCMTSSEHESGTDRLQETASLLGLAEDAIVVNVQGDEPLIPPAVINQVARNLQQSDAAIATLSEPIDSMADVLNPNVVKVVANSDGMALYFSRAPIPWPRDLALATDLNRYQELPGGAEYYRHIGIYAYRVSTLNDFVGWPVAMLENTEKLEQLRAMANGRSIHVAAACETIPAGVDTVEDLDRVRGLLES